MYHVLTILLHRPFVADGHLYNTSRSIPVNSFLLCASAADSISALLRVYDKAFSVRHAPYLISYATYVAATIHVRIVAKRSTASEARENLEVCLGVFRDNQKTNWAVRRAKTIVEGLIKRLGVKVADLGGDPGGTSQGRARPEPPSFESQVSQTRNRCSGGREALGSGSNSQLMPGHSESPSAGWSDIDGIIQSFVRGQDGNYADFSGAMGQMDGDQIQHRPGSPAETGIQEFGGGVDGTSASWVGFLPGAEAPGGTASYDDLLFGFNGSALDSSFY